MRVLANEVGVDFEECCLFEIVVATGKWEQMGIVRAVFEIHRFIRKSLKSIASGSL